MAKKITKPSSPEAVRKIHVQNAEDIRNALKLCEEGARITYINMFGYRISPPDSGATNQIQEGLRKNCLPLREAAGFEEAGDDLENFLALVISQAKVFRVQFYYEGDKAKDKDAQKTLFEVAKSPMFFSEEGRVSSIHLDVSATKTFMAESLEFHSKMQEYLDFQLKKAK